MNHLIMSKTVHVTKLESLLDLPSTKNVSVFNAVHLHVFQSTSIFSKSSFRSNFYDNLTIPYGDTSIVKFYALNIALESKRMQPFELYDMLKRVSSKKILLKF
jgi:hypothetical protein